MVIRLCTCDNIADDPEQLFQMIGMYERTDRHMQDSWMDSKYRSFFAIEDEIHSQFQVIEPHCGVFSVQRMI